jgi:hypothetical protein
MITIKVDTYGSSLTEYYIEPEEIKFLKKTQSPTRVYNSTRVGYNTIYSIKIDSEWHNISEDVFNEIMTYKNAITRQQIMNNILDD